MYIIINSEKKSSSDVFNNLIPGINNILISNDLYMKISELTSRIKQLEAIKMNVNISDKSIKNKKLEQLKLLKRLYRKR